jgi:adenylate cyclase class IV
MKINVRIDDMQELKALTNDYGFESVDVMAGILLRYAFENVEIAVDRHVMACRERMRARRSAE